MIDPETLAESRRLLNQARLVAEAPAAQLSPMGHTQSASSLPPGLTFTDTGNVTAVNTSTLTNCGQWINYAIATGSDDQLRNANKRCADELQLLQQGPPDRRAETAQERRERIAANYEGVLAGVVARQERMSVTLVREDRAAMGRDPRTGAKTKAVAK